MIWYVFTRSLAAGDPDLMGRLDEAFDLLGHLHADRDRLTPGLALGPLRNFGTVCQDRRAWGVGETQDAWTIVDRGSWTYADDPELVADPWTTWDRLREESRAFVATEAAADWDVWTLMRYDDVHAALRDPELFSSRSVLHVYQGPKLIDPAEADAVRGMIPEELDPPEHTKYRQLLTPLFAPQVVETLEPMIRSWCVELIESFVARGRCDLNQDFARQYPTMIFLRLMGLPKGGVGDFLATVHDRIREATQMGASEQQSMSAGVHHGDDGVHEHGARRASRRTRRTTS